ncbi:MAG: alpha/beta fold hydrolase [Ilumatobacteraceae bacterium]
MSTSFTNIGSVQIEIETVGSGPTLLFLHGEDGLMFSRPFIEQLAAEHEVLVPHHPSWGRSTRGAHVNRVQDIALVYAELIESSGVPVDIVGVSFGGWLAAEIAVLRPRNLGSIVLAAPTGVRFGDPQERNFVDLYVQDFDDLPAILYSTAERAPVLASCTDDQFLYLAEAQEAMTRYCWNPYMHNPDLVALLRRIEVPCCLISGADDHFVLRKDYFSRFAALIGPAGCAHVVIDDVGHRLEEEDPAALAKCTETFLAEQAFVIGTNPQEHRHV